MKTMKHKIYISKSNQASEQTLNVIRKLLEYNNVEKAEYDGRDYSSMPIKTSDALILVSYPEAKEGNNVYLGKGTYIETLKASTLRIPILFFDGERFYHYKEILLNDKNDYQKKYGVMEIAEGFSQDDLPVFLKSFPFRPREIEEQGIEMA